MQAQDLLLGRVLVAEVSTQAATEVEVEVAEASTQRGALRLDVGTLGVIIAAEAFFAQAAVAEASVVEEALQGVLDRSCNVREALKGVKRLMCLLKVVWFRRFEGPRQALTGTTVQPLMRLSITHDEWGSPINSVRLKVADRDIEQSTVFAKEITPVDRRHLATGAKTVAPKQMSYPARHRSRDTKNL
ncbi:hypothetical protein [Corynebacterium sputi]|uniref:hypothetical protein n=1 Tax=Corynebacterium sputi TaxID=489915 RepID=UPI00047AAD0C|nr:hypothetical protein [Corynebacterium sputi]